MDDLTEGVTLAHDAFPNVMKFARHMLHDGQLKLQPLRDATWVSKTHADLSQERVMTCILFRSGQWQVEMIMALPNAAAPLHRHNHVHSADVILCGDLSGTVDGRSVAKPRGANLCANLMSLPAGVWHGGVTGKGLIVLSFQKWEGLEPTFVANDWELYRGH